MPRGPAPAWRRRKEPVLDTHVLASVQQSGGIGRHNDAGHYATLWIRGLASREEADEWKRALHRSARYLDRTRAAPVGVSTRIHRVGNGQYEIEFKAIDKTHARKYMLDTYGPDRSKWPYDPRRKVPRE